MLSSRFSSLQEKRCHLPHDEDANKAEQGAEDEAQHERSGVQIQAHEDIANEAKDRGDENVIQAIVDAVGANAAEEKNRWKQHAVGDLEHRQAVAHQGHVESAQE